MMSKWISADSIINKFNSHVGFTTCADVERAIKLIQDAPSIDLNDYVPKDFHDKTCEAMAKAHQEEIANMVSVVRCKECRYYKQSEAFCENGNGLWQAGNECFCSYGERKE